MLEVKLLGVVAFIFNPDPQKTEAGTSEFDSQSGAGSVFQGSQSYILRLFLKQKKTRVELGHGSLVECMSIMHEALGPIPITVD